MRWIALLYMALLVLGHSRKEIIDPDDFDELKEHFPPFIFHIIDFRISTSEAIERFKEEIAEVVRPFPLKKEMIEEGDLGKLIDIVFDLEKKQGFSGFVDFKPLNLTGLNEEVESAFSDFRKSDIEDTKTKLSELEEKILRSYSKYTMSEDPNFSESRFSVLDDIEMKTSASYSSDGGVSSSNENFYTRKFYRNYLKALKFKITNRELEVSHIQLARFELPSIAQKSLVNVIYLVQNGIILITEQQAKDYGLRLFELYKALIRYLSKQVRADSEGIWIKILDETKDFIFNNVLNPYSKESIHKNPIFSNSVKYFLDDLKKKLIAFDPGQESESQN